MAISPGDLAAPVLPAGPSAGHPGTDLSTSSPSSLIATGTSKSLVHPLRAPSSAVHQGSPLLLQVLQHASASNRKHQLDDRRLVAAHPVGCPCEMVDASALVRAGTPLVQNQVASGDGAVDGLGLERRSTASALTCSAVPAGLRGWGSAAGALAAPSSRRSMMTIWANDSLGMIQAGTATGAGPHSVQLASLQQAFPGEVLDLSPSGRGRCPVGLLEVQRLSHCCASASGPRSTSSAGERTLTSAVMMCRCLE